MKIIGAAVLCLLASFASAGTDVRETAYGEGGVYSVSIDTTSGAVQIDVKPSRFQKDRFVIELFNDDDADDLHCAFTSSVSTITSPSLNTNYGRRIAPRTAWTVAIPDAMSVYCRVAGSGSAASAIAVATQLK